MDEKIFVVGLCYFVACCAGSLVLGPFPPVEIVPVNSMVSFTCRVNSSALPHGSSVSAIIWNRQGVTMGNTGIFNTLTFNVTKENLSGIAVWCIVLTDNAMNRIFSTYNATLKVYGPPLSPLNLTAKALLSAYIITFSWTTPYSPDGVQLSYTVTVTNTNTSMVRNYTTSNTSITLTRSDVEGDGECDHYIWSVTTVNPAGISVSANYTTAVSFVSAPNVMQHNILSCNENSTLVITIEPPTEFFNNTIYTVNLLNTNATMEIMNNLNLMFRIPDSRIWTNITVIVKNQCKESLIPVSFNSTVECPTSPTTTMTTEITVSKPDITTPQSPSSLPTSTTNPTLGPVWAYGIGVIVLPVAVVVLALVPLLLYCWWRKRKRTYKTCCKSSSVKPSDHSSSEMMMIEKPETADQSAPVQSVSDLMSKLPEYMTPADARKEAEVIKQQNGACSKHSTLRSIQEAEQPLGVGVYDTPSFSKPTSVKQVMDMPTYSDVFQSKTNSLRTNQREGSTKGNSLKANQRETLNKQSHSSAPPPPPPPGPCDYASLQHDTGQPGAQENNTYDIPQDGDASRLYSSVGQPAQALSKDKYSELQHMSSSGDRVHGTTDVVEYSVVGPKTCPPTVPPPPSAEAVKELNL